MPSVGEPATAITVHPTAVVSRESELGEGVTVGPYAVIEAGAVVGAGTTVMAHAILTGFATVGRQCQIHYGAVIGHEPQDVGFDGAPSRAVIGDRTIVREYATVHRATREDGATVVGEHGFLMAHSHVAHDCRIGSRAVLCNGALVAGHSEVGERAFLSGNTVIHQFCRVGRVVMLSGVSGVGRDIGPYLTVAGRSDVMGFNTVGMRRAGLDSAARQRVKEAYRHFFGAPDMAAGLARVRELGEDHEEIAAILAFYAASRRGFSRPPAGHALDSADVSAGS